MLANMIASLIEHGRIKTTVAKAKAVRPLAEKLVTLAKTNTLHSRRRALALLQSSSRRTEEAVKKLFTEVGPRCAGRSGGYTRIVKLGPRASDSAPMAHLEWVDLSAPAGESPSESSKEEKTSKEAKGSKSAKKS